MKKLLLVFGVLLSWLPCHNVFAQAPEFIYYKFEDSLSVNNEASSPVGLNPVAIHDSLGWVATGGFNGSGALTGNGSHVPGGGIRTGWNTRIDGSFTVSFWFAPPASGEGMIFSDSLLELVCMTTKSGNNTVLFLYSPDIGYSYGMAPADSLHVAHLVYDEMAVTFTAYIDGVRQAQTQLETSLSNRGSGLIIGDSYGGDGPPFGLNGTIDEFRWYNRALSATEIANTLDIDVSPIGNCPSFSHLSIDSISGTAMKIHWTPGQGNTSWFLEYDTAGFVPGTGTLLTGTYPVDPPEVIITGLTPETEYDIHFGEQCNTGDSIYNKAPYTILTTVPCQRVSDLTITNITDSTAELQWNFIGDVQEFYLVYGPQGFDPNNSGMADTISGLSNTLTGLSYGTRYDVYVVANCGSGFGIGDTVTETFTTTCPVFIAPFFEDFEDSVWVGGTDFNYNDVFYPCWNRQTTHLHSQFFWGVREGSSLRGPAWGNGGTGKYLFTKIFGSGDGSGDTAELYTPLIDVSQLIDPYVSFYYHRYSTNNQPLPDIRVEINDGSGWTGITTLLGADQNNLTDPYRKTGVNIAAFGDTVQVRFSAFKLSQYSEMGLDDFEIGEAPPATCPEVSKVISMGSNKDTAVVLQISPSEHQYNFEWGPVDFLQGTGCLGTGSYIDTVDECIESNSVYDLYVQSNCQDSGLGMSSWAGPFTFCTPFTAPYFNNFDENPTSDCWQSYSKSSSSGASSQGTDVYDNYIEYTPGGAIDEQAFSGDYTLRLYDDVPNEGDTIFSVSPRFVDMAEGDKQVRFLAKTRNDFAQTGELLIGTINSFLEGSSFHPLDTFIVNTNWQEFVVELDPAGTAYNGTDQIIAFKLGNGLTVIHIDDFHYEKVPPCTPPVVTSIQPGFVTGSSAMMHWDAGEESLVNMVWGVPGFEPDDAKLGTASSTDSFYRISGLTSGSDYQFYLRGICDDDTTQWIGPVNFSTGCGIKAAPFIENFDGANWFSPPRAINEPNRGDLLDSCWRRNIRTSTVKARGEFVLVGNPFYFTWGVQNGTSNTTTGPSKDISGQGNFIYTVPYDTRFGDVADIYSPVIDISGLNAPYLTFYYHRFGIHLPDVSVQINDGNGWTTAYTITGQQQTSNDDSFRKVGLDLNSYGDTLRVRFRATLVDPDLYYAEAKMAMDNFSIAERPTCLEPDSLQASFVLDTGNGTWSTALEWTDTPGAISYEVSLQSAPANSSLGTKVKFVTSDPFYVLDTLPENSCYNYTVRAICGMGDTSASSYTLPFCTPCQPVSAPYVEVFNAQTLIRYNTCWNHEYVKRTLGYVYEWQTISGPSRPIVFTTGPEGGSSPQDYYAYTSSTYGESGDRAALYAPMVDIRSLSHPEVYFAYHMYGADIDTLYLDIYDGRIWHQDVWHLYGEQQTGSDSPWEDTTISLNAYKATGFVKARFRAKKLGGFVADGDIAIDDFRISDSLSCPFPLKVWADSTWGRQVLLQWQAVNGVQDYTLEYGPSGFPYGQGTRITTSADSAVITLPGNSYRLYDVYLRNNCGVGDSSIVWGPLPFHLNLTEPCDDMEDYDPGIIEGQSALVRGWDDDHYVGNPDYNFIRSGGDAEITDDNALSGSQSLYLRENGPSGYSDVSAVFTPISSGKYSISFSFFTGDDVVAQYDLQQVSFVSGSNSSSEHYVVAYLDSAGTARITDLGGSRTYGIYSFDPGRWNTIEHIFDFENDTIWLVINGQHAHSGWNKIGMLSFVDQIDGVNFYTLPDQNSASAYYVDDFCVTSYICPQPTDLTADNIQCTQAMLSWASGVGEATTFVEYDTTGFILGQGTRYEAAANQDTLTSLIPGTTYDVYVGEVCGYDTVFTGPLSLSLPTEAIADFTIHKGSPTLSSLMVTFNGSISVAASGYHWDFGDGSSDSVASPIHTYTGNGSYDVQLIIHSDCGSDTITKTVQVSGISVQENILSRSLEVYPNPADNRIQIRFETQSSEDVMIRLNDLSGKAIIREAVSDINGEYRGEIDLKHLSKGTYLLEISMGDMKAIRRIVKE